MQPSNSRNLNRPTPSSRGMWARRLTHSFRRACEYALAMIGAANLIYLCCLDLSIMTSPSMAPTLKGTSIKNGDRVLAERVSYWFRSPRRWEVVMYFNPQKIRVMKRVIALPGQTICIPREGEILIDGQRVLPPDSSSKYWYYPQGDLAKGKTVPCGDDYYVLGDASGDSEDSRFNGPLPASKVAGRAWLIVWPWDRMGFVNP
jgi:signal peptidase I